VRPNNSLRWLILAPAIFFALTTPANAEPQLGLATTYYIIDEIPPLRSTSEYPICGTETENNINRSYDGEPYENCTGDLFMVHMTGYIDIPEHTTIEFWLATDDGGYANIGGNEFEYWNDQGCTWIPSGQLDIEAGIQPLDVWMYENGGGTCVMLAWNIDDEGWSIVPDEAFTQTSTPTTTTSTSTTVPETTTTSTTTTTTEPATTTTEQTTTTIPETVSTLANTTTTTTVYVPPATTTTEPEPEETTTTTEPEPIEEEAPPPDTTVPEPEDDEPDETTPETLPQDEPDTPQPETDDPETESTPEEADQTEETEEESSESTIPDSEEPDTQEPAIEELDAEEPEMEELDAEELQEAITAILEEEPTQEQAVALATSPEVLANISEEQAEQIFETLDVAALTEEQTTELIAAVQDAPTEVREAFENKVDIFKNALDTYIPTGSNIPVGERRALIAIGAALTAAAATRIRR
jgi:hypothetical protein